MANKDLKKRKGERLDKFFRFSGMGFQMLAIIGISAWGGVKLDEKYSPENPWFTMGLSLFGVFASLYLVIKEVRNLNS